ncbi:MAG TPA: type II secretion system F family protein [Actinomycetota bacterium]|jgi:tight adherence protein B|nr:type II secretion system F family protein [Actinomycetota bacterium]
MIDELEKLLGTDAWLTLVLGAAFVAAFLVAVLLLSVGAKGRRRRSMANMMLGRGKDVAPETTWMPAGLAQAGTRFAEAGGFSSGLDLKLEQAGLPMKAGEFVALTAVCAVAGGVLGAFLLANIVVVLLVAAVGSLIPYVWLLRARSQRQKKMAEQLADVLSILASSLRAGHSFLQALDQVANEIKDPSAAEFHRVVSEIRLGRSVDDAMVEMADRIGSEDMRWAVMAVNIQRQVGGNLAEVLDIVANTVRERAYVHRQVRVLSAEGRISIGILSALPFGIFFYLMLVNPDYIGVLFTHPIGRILLIAGAALMGAGIFVMTRIVRVDV